MKIQCQSCQAKYTIADEKVLGKVVKIRCKKCSATIVINGNETRPAEDAADTNVFDYNAQSNEQWTVNVADGDQRTLTAAEIVTEYRAGVVNDDTYCWKDGMADWLPLREIEALYAAVKLAPSRGPAASFDEISIPPQSVQHAANAGANPLFSASEVANAVDSPFAANAAPAATNGNGNGHGALFGGGDALAAAPAAARRGGGRGQGADLFGNVAAAGGEEDVMTSAAAGGGHAAAGGGMATTAEDAKLTGQRNENSVLFSLSALTDPGKKSEENKTTATADGSGLIDIRALSKTMEGGDKHDKDSRVDDIMNLSGGGAFGAALAAPILAPPPLEMTADPAMLATGQKNNKTLLFAILGGAALIAVGIVVAVVLTHGGSDASKDTTGAASAMASATAPGSTAGGSDTSSTSTATTPTTTAADNTPPPPGTGQTTSTHGGSAPKHDTGGAVAAAPKHNDSPAPPPAAPDPPKQEGPKDFGSALAAAAGAKPPAATDNGGGGGSTAPFDRGAAAGALGAVNVQSCKKADGPTGSGHVKVTFAPNGTVSAAVIDGGPFPGTPVGGCIAGKYRGAHIPAFGGGAVTVGKSFTVN